MFENSQILCLIRSKFKSLQKGACYEDNFSPSLDLEIYWSITCHQERKFIFKTTRGPGRNSFLDFSYQTNHPVGITYLPNKKSEHIAKSKVNSV